MFDKKTEKETMLTTLSGSKFLPSLCYKHVLYEESKAEGW